MKLPSFFSHGMVIGKIAKIWGHVEKNFEKKIFASFLGKKYETVADENGRFEFTFVSENFGGPHTLTIDEIIIRNVYIGRVWLCGGQSNMEERINRIKFSAKNEPQIRVFQAEKGMNFDAPQQNVNGNWHTATDDFLNHVFAVPYFFAQKINEILNDGVPIGLVCFPAGGTPIEGWLPENLLPPHYLHELKKLQGNDFVQKSTEEAENTKRAWLAELNENDDGLRKRAIRAANFEEPSQQKNQRLEDEISCATENEWFSPKFDDSDWESRALLDSSGFPEYGSVWFRKKIFLAKKFSKAKINFGRVEDSVTVYVNGVEITHIEYKYPICVCALPENLLVEGENTIVVRVVGESNRPKVVPGKEYFLEHNDEKINLDTEWKCRVGKKMPPAPPGVWFYGYPSGVYNFLLAPILGLCADGMIWYQGESNTKNPAEYEALFEIFAKFIREHFGEKFPIIFTQLANFIDPFNDGECWAALREQQRRCLRLPHTAMAVTIDCGEYNDLHPFDKKTVGERLALHALRMVYTKRIISDGPTVNGFDFENGKLTVNFSNAQDLWAKNGRPQLEIFDENGNSQKIFAATENNSLVARCEKIPAKIRFGWEDCPPVTLYNACNLPASPFEL